VFTFRSHGRFGYDRSATKTRGSNRYMKTTMLALAAASLTIPALPQQAQARTHHHSQYYNGKVWRDSHGRLRCKRPNGTTGLIIGAAGGALVGRAIDTHGERATGTIIGAAAGALIGRSVERSRVRCR
jgi:outer membrane lipoprotein SlyB